MGHIYPEWLTKRIELYAEKSLAEQLDMKYWDEMNGTTKHRDWVTNIKTSVLKPKQ